MSYEYHGAVPYLSTCQHDVVPRVHGGSIVLILNTMIVHRKSSLVNALTKSIVNVVGECTVPNVGRSVGIGDPHA